ncbi:MAG: SulP family inorganic anion transporter [Proteobacteria bacterium]|nr:SulP family inorganic anion transporter [Pseudomonadota bacterium]
MPETRYAASTATLLTDVLAGLSLGGLVLPEAVAYAGMANLPPAAGVIALLGGLVVYGLVGTSRFAVVSATSSSAAVLAAVTATLAPGDAALRAELATGLVLMTGLFFMIAAALRLGQVSEFVAKPVLRGFSFGLALVIALKQLAQVAGARTEHGDIVHLVVALLAAPWPRAGLAIGASALALLFALQRWRRVPGALVVIVLGMLLASRIDLGARGVGVVGAVGTQVALPAIPMLSRIEWLSLAEVAFATMFVLYAESYGTIRTLAARHDDAVAPTRDLLALGLANLVSGLMRGMPVGAGYSASAANEAAGARSQRSAWICAAAVLVVVATLQPALALIPQPVLAAIVIHAVSRTLSPAALAPYFAWHRDRLVVVAALLGVPLLGVLDGLLAAIAISLLMTLRRLADAKVSELGRLGDGHDFVSLALHANATPIADIVVLRPETPVFFANVEHMVAAMRRAIDARAPVRNVIVSLEESPDLDGTSVEALRDFAQEMQRAGHRLVLARLKPAARGVLQRAAILAETELLELSVDDAVLLVTTRR